MIQIESEKAIIYMTAIGKLTNNDYDKMLPILNEKIETFGKVSWYFQMKDFNGWSLSAFWRDVKFDIKNKDKLYKVAIIGYNDWQKLMTEFMKPFTNADIQFFDDKDENEAKKWIKS